MHPLPPALLTLVRSGPDPETALRRLEHLAEAGADLSAPALEASLPQLLLASGFLARALTRWPEAVQILDDDLYVPITAERLTAWYAERAPADPGDLDGVMAALRWMKTLAFIRITARDVALHAPVPETCAELTLIAEVAAEQAVKTARAVVEQRLGPAETPEGAPIPFVVMGMGKLGGHELNYSSDIDIIYFYGTDEGTGGHQDTTPHQHFSEVCKLTTRILGEVTSDGFVFRVDLRLRPEGRSGPLCNALAGAEAYYESWGRTWERMAWLRARPIAGDRSLGEDLLDRLSPWIYRRSLDYRVLEDVRAIKQAIEAQRSAAVALGRARGVDLKLDPGGIRAVEFSANALQLIHAGRNPALRDPSTLNALDRLLAAGHLNAADHEALAEAYLFLRRIEHRIQMEDQRQTHRLPSGLALERLARRLGYEGDPPSVELTSDLEARRAQVAPIYDGILRLDDDDAAPPEGREPVSPAARFILASGTPDSERVTLFAEAGFADPEQAVHLVHITRRRPGCPFSPRADARARALGELLMSEVIRASEPERALTHLAALFSDPRDHGFLVRLLVARPDLQRLLITVLASSDFLSEALIRRPALLEALATPRQGAARALGGGARMTRALTQAGHDEDDEGHLEHLAWLRQHEMVVIGLGDLGAVLTPAEVERALTLLAEGVLQAVAERARRMLARRHGEPEGARWCIVGMGKLGGSEMSYGSDLDLIFLYEPGPGDDGLTLTEAVRPLSTREWFTRFVQRIISLLSMPTRVGPLYAVDTRLRPGGSQGTLVTSMRAFEAWHRQRAGAWERFALVRARPVAGDRTLRHKVSALLADLTWHRPIGPDAFGEVARLRGRIEAEVAREGPDRYNPKAGRGGLVDLEFMAQGLQLRHGDGEEALHTPSTRQALARLTEAGHLLEGEGLIAAYDFLRRLEHRLRIVRARSMPELRADPTTLDRLARRLGYRVDPLAPDGPSPGVALHADYRRMTELVRDRFQAVFDTLTVMSTTTKTSDIEESI